MRVPVPVSSSLLRLALSTDRMYYRQKGQSRKLTIRQCQHFTIILIASLYATNCKWQSGEGGLGLVWRMLCTSQWLGQAALASASVSAMASFLKSFWCAFNFRDTASLKSPIKLLLCGSCKATSHAGSPSRYAFNLVIKQPE